MLHTLNLIAMGIGFMGFIAIGVVALILPFMIALKVLDAAAEWMGLYR